MRNRDLLDKLNRVKDIMFDDPDKALKLIESIQVKEVDLEDYYELAMITADILYYNDQFDRAVDTYKKVLELPIKNIDRAKCYYHIGCSYYEKREYTRAIKNLEMALDLTVDHTMIRRTYRWLALAYKDNRNFEKCIEVLDRLIKLYEEAGVHNDELREDVVNAYVEMSMCYWQLHDGNKSEEYFNKVINEKKINPNITAWAFAIKAHRLYENKNWTMALDLYKKAISLTNSEENKRDWEKYADTCEKELKKLR